MRLGDLDRLKEVLERNFGHTGGAAVMHQLIDVASTIDPLRAAGGCYCRECRYHESTEGGCDYCALHESTCSKFCGDGKKEAQDA